MMSTVRISVLTYVMVLAAAVPIDARCISVRDGYSSLCPPQCTCAGQVVNCSASDLRSVPDIMWTNITELYMNNNDLERLSRQDLAGCYQLQKLDLSFNKIRDIDNESFADTVELRYLSLSSNGLNLNTISSDVFSYVKRLKALMLSGNSWENNTVYPGELFVGLKYLNTLSIDGVPDAPFPPEFALLRSLSVLYIYGGLNVVTNETFYVFRNTSVSNLIIETWNHLRGLEPMSFGHFRNLNKLDLSNNVRLGFENVSIAFYGLQHTKLQSLVLKNIVSQDDPNPVVTADFFRSLNVKKLRTLSLSTNGLVRIEPGFSKHLPQLRKLILSGNKLLNSFELADDISMLKHLSSLDVSHQYCPAQFEDPDSFDEFDGNTGIGKSSVDKKVYPKMECKTYFQANCTQLFSARPQKQLTEFFPPGDPICLKLPPELVTLNLLSALRLAQHTLPPITIYGGKCLDRVIMASNGLQRISGPIYFRTPPKKLTVVDLSNNQIQCLSPDAFKLSRSAGCKINRLILSKNSLADQLQRDENGTTFQYFDQLQVLKLDQNQIKILPPRVFIHLSNLQTLRLDGNSLRVIEFEFDHMKKLSYATLANNLISSLSDDNIQKLSRGFARRPPLRINLNDNPLQCSCESLRMLHWMIANRDNFDYFDDNSCVFEGRYVTFRNLSKVIMPKLTFQCSEYIAVFTSVTLLVTVSFVLSMSACCYRHRWEIRYAFLKLTQRGQRYQQLIDETVEYDYDAFVVYNIEDRQWVNEQLVPHLEHIDNRDDSVINGSELELGDSVHLTQFRLCVHERDFPPGQEIISNIWQKLERSRKVILVISKSFTESDFCNYETNLARMLSVEKGRNVLIPILLELPDFEKISDSLHWILRKVTYIEWLQDEGQRDQFWYNVRKALRERDDKQRSTDEYEIS